MTTIAEYLDFIPTTYPPNLTREQSIANCVLGLSGELLEWVEECWGSEKELLEAGDVLYYLATLARTIGVDLSQIISQVEGTHYNPLHQAGSDEVIRSLTDITKKYLYYNPPRYSEDQFREKLAPILKDILCHITRDQQLDSIVQANVQKLTDRYKPTPNLEA